MSEIDGERNQGAPNSGNNRVLSSGNSLTESRQSFTKAPTHAFDNTRVKSYSHKANIIPPV